jgi:hypothetical protein
VVDPPARPVGGHYVERPDMIDGQAMGAAVERQAAAEEVPDDADRWRGAVHHGKPVRSDGLDDVAPARAGLDVRRPGDRVDPHVPVVQLEAEQKRVAEVGQHLGQMPRGLRRDAEPVGSGVADRALDVLDARGGADGGRTLIDVEVPRAASGVVPGRVREHQRERLGRRCLGGNGCG